MIDAQLFYTIFFIIPIAGSITLSIAYLAYLESYNQKVIWLPIIIGFITPVILVLFRTDLYIFGYIVWIAFTISFWYSWKKTAKRLGEIGEINLDDYIGISEKSTTDADSRGARAYSI